MGRAKATTIDGHTATQMQNYAIHAIESAGGIARRRNVGAARYGKRFIRFGQPGDHDVEGVLPPVGQFISIEIKTRNDDPTAAQLERMYRLREIGAIAIIAETTADIDAALIPFAEPARADA